MTATLPLAALGLFAKRVSIVLGVMLALLAAATSATRMIDDLEHGAVREPVHAHSAVSLALMDIDHPAATQTNDGTPDDRATPHHHHGDSGSTMVASTLGWDAARASSRIAAIFRPVRLLTDDLSSGLSRPPRSITRLV